MNMAKRVTEDGIVVLQLSGGMRMGPDCENLKEGAGELLQQNERRIILDLSPLRLIDSAGVGAIVACFSRVKKEGGTLLVAGATGMVETVLKLAQLQRAIAFFPTVAEAASNFPPADSSSAHSS